MALAALIPVASASQLEEAARAANDAQQKQPVIQGLAAHVEKRWTSARYSKKRYIENRLLECVRQRNVEYEPEKLAEIRKHGGSEIYMGITSAKCRAAAAWLRDTLLGTGVDKPWKLDHTPIPDLPPEVLQRVHQQLSQLVMQFMQANGGMPPPPEMVRQQAEHMRDQVQNELDEESANRVKRMEDKMEDQLVEGGFIEALSEFIEDIVTFPTAIMKGPVLRKRKTLKWVNGGLIPVDELKLEWERVSPFNAYPAGWSTSPQDGPFIERHKFTREDLEAMIGVDGYSESAIRSVLSNFEMLTTLDTAIDTAEAIVTNKDPMAVNERTDVVDGIQLWDNIQGKLLKEWGVPDVEDLEKSYPCEVIKIGSTVIRAVLNYDPLGRKPYYAASYEAVPGAFWGNGVADLVRDCQNMCNAMARSLANNAGLSSGPMVGVNVSRLPEGEDVTQVYPWRVFQFQTSDYQDNSAPVMFFQPQSNAQELMNVYEQFAKIADEVSGIPRYMQGEHTPGVGRTSSGLSMLINNASKGIKSVISNIDKRVVEPLLQRLYQHNIRYSQDPDLIGDVNIVAKGAMSLVTKEAAAVRRAEFLQLVLNSPVASQIVGMQGAAELLRESARLLDVNPDRIVPTRDALAAQLAQQERERQMMLQMQMNPETENVQFQRDANGAVVGATKQKPRQLLHDGSPAGGRSHNFNVNRATGSNN